MTIPKQILDKLAEKLLESPSIKALTQDRVSVGGSAQRYHAGGTVGLRPNEVPAILSPGVSFVTREVYDRMMAHLPPADPQRSAEPLTYVVSADGEISKVEP